jgi:glucose-6-phosphate 1-dehydrogenase
MQKPDNCIIVIFGASGDLTKRKLIPAIFDLCAQKLLPEKFSLLGVGRTEFSDEAFRKSMLESLEKYSEHKNNDTDLLTKFSERLHYISFDTNSADEYTKLKNKLAEIDVNNGTSDNFIYYLATPPKIYGTIAENLAAQGLNHQDENTGWRRIIVEKPFGYDLKSARELNKKLLSFFTEDQIYRIDHYLGKETVQNLLVFRFANGIFEPLWNQKYIDKIEITSAEDIGVEDRGGYYDGSGALRDMIQNHMLQLTGLFAMEPPSNFAADSIRNETLKVFQSIRPINKGDVENYVIRGQYTESVIRGEKVKGYREEKDIPPDSRTETFVAMKFFIDNWRWGGTPFYVRSGKRLPARVTEIVIHFKPTPHSLFGKTWDDSLSHNELIIRIQPDEGILLKFGMKMPGSGFKVKTVNMDFHYSDLSDIYLPTAYERLLLDSILGDQTLYTRGDAVEACWKFIDPILQEWKDNPESKVYGYPAGTWGPPEADKLMEGDENSWRFPCKNLTNDGVYCEL